MWSNEPSKARQQEKQGILPCFEHGYLPMHYAEMQTYENLQGEARIMKNNKNRKIKLKFLDLVVELEGQRSLEGKALALMNSLIESRIKLNELENSDSEGAGARELPKEKKITIDTMFS